jgi:hypothetical protein
LTGSCQFPYEHAMTDIVGDDVPFEFDVPLPPTGGTNPFLPTTDFEAQFSDTPSPHFHVTFTPDALAVNTMSGHQTLRFAATWGGVSPPTRFFNVCFQRQELIKHDDISDAGEIVAGVAVGGVFGGILGGPAGAVIGAIGLGVFTGSECEGDDQDEVVLFGSVNAMTVRIDQSAKTCLPFAVPIRDEETLDIRTQGFECDFSCAEHWDDDFVNAPNDVVGTTHMAFTSNENFGVPAVGVPATFSILSQPELTTTKSRHFSAGDYRMAVTLTEAAAGVP